MATPMDDGTLVPMKDGTSKTVRELLQEEKAKIIEANKKYSKMGEYIGDWGVGQNKERLLKNIHKNLIGVDKMGVLRPAEDLAYFLLFCNQNGINPLKRQAYAIYQRTNVGGSWMEKMEPVVSIHGLRALARQADKPRYAYTGKAIYEESDGKLVSATVPVYGYVLPDQAPVEITRFEAVYDEFCKVWPKDDKDGKYKAGDPMGTWAKMPRVMLAKCAEANALRQGFDIGGGVHIEEELAANNQPMKLGIENEEAE